MLDPGHEGEGIAASVACVVHPQSRNRSGLRDLEEVVPPERLRFDHIIFVRGRKVRCCILELLDYGECLPVRQFGTCSAVAHQTVSKE